MLYHQNILAQVKSGSRRLPASQTFSPAISPFDWRHSHTSARSRKYQPFATAPCPLGGSPVTSVDCTVQVTAGVTASSGRIAPRSAKRRRLGVCGPTSAGVSPTTRMTRVGCMLQLRQLEDAERIRTPAPIRAPRDLDGRRIRWQYRLAAKRRAATGSDREARLDRPEQGAQAGRLAALRASRPAVGIPREDVKMRPGLGLGDEALEEQRRRDRARSAGLAGIVEVGDR